MKLRHINRRGQVFLRHSVYSRSLKVKQKVWTWRDDSTLLNADKDHIIIISKDERQLHKHYNAIYCRLLEPKPLIIVYSPLNIDTSLLACYTHPCTRWTQFVV